MKLKLGKRYVRRDGQITDRLTRNTLTITMFPNHTFWDTAYPGHSYKPDGSYSATERQSAHDIVKEYIDPKSKLPRAMLHRWAFSLLGKHGEEGICTFVVRQTARLYKVSYIEQGSKCGPIVRISAPRVKP